VRTNSPCSRPSWHLVRLSRSRWTLKLGGALPPGPYRLLAQADESNGSVASEAGTAGRPFTAVR
jgi:hypothetical protein